MEFKNPRRLENGLDVYVLPTDKFKTISLRMVFQRTLGREQASKNALLPLVLRRGCEPWPTTRDLAKRLESLYGTQLGGDIGKIGERHLIEFYLDVVNEKFFAADERLLENALDTLKSMIMEPVNAGGAFKEEFFHQEKENLRQRIRGVINDKRRYSFNRALLEMCSTEPFGTHKYGNEESLDSITNEDLYHHYQGVLDSSPVALFVVGDVSANRIYELVTERFSFKVNQAIDLPNSIVNIPVEEEKEIIEEERVQQSVLVMGYRTYTSYNDSDYYALVLANGILGGFPHSKLFANVREKASLAYYAGASMEATKGLLLINAGIEAANYKKAVSIIKDQVKALQDGDISELEMEATRKGLANVWRSMDDDAGQIIDSGLFGMVNNRMASTAESIDAINRLTVDDVVEAARKWRLDTVYFLRPNLKGGEGQ